MTTAAQARYIENLRDNRSTLTIDDDHILNNIDLINQALVREGKTVDQDALYEWMEGLIEVHNHELECDLDELTTTEASALIDALGNGYHIALVGNLHQLAGYYIRAIILELKDFVAERTAKVEEHIERAERIADGIDAVDSARLDELVEQAVAHYDTFQIQQAFGVQHDCEATIINRAHMERLEARLNEAKADLTKHVTVRVAADVVRRASMSILAGDRERDLMRRYIISSTNAQAAMAKKGA